MGAVDGYGGRRLTAGWAIWLVRLLLVAGSAVALWGAARIHADFLTVASADVSDKAPLFWEVIGLFAAAGLAFGLALRIPFPRPRPAWGRLVFLLVALMPAEHLWTVIGVGLEGDPTFLRSLFWFDEWSVVHVAAALAGVAAAGVIGARRAKV